MAYACAFITKDIGGRVLGYGFSSFFEHPDGTLEPDVHYALDVVQASN